MLALDDSKWGELLGGYRTPYDARPALARLARGEGAWEELWENLHHQGDLGEASYAAVPHLVRIMQAAQSRDWNFYAIVSIIEIERHRNTNPRLPGWLAGGYLAAWTEIGTLAVRDLPAASDPMIVQQILAAVALAKGQLKLGMIIFDIDEPQVEEWVERHFHWSELYHDNAS